MNEEQRERHRIANRKWALRKRRAAGSLPWAEHPKKVKLARPPKLTPEEASARKRARYQLKRSEVIEYQKAWAARNPDLVALVRREAHVRRSERIRVTRQLERISYRRILERDDWQCHLCGLPINSLRSLHFDHKIPLSKGGAHAEVNISPSHAWCNLKKAARLIA